MNKHISLFRFHSPQKQQKIIHPFEQLTARQSSKKIQFKKSLNLQKLNSSKNKINQNLNSSRLSKNSSKSTHITSNNFLIKLPNAFYNDSKTIYLDRSRTMSQKSMCYQVRPMSLSQRKKLQQSKLQKIVNRRKTQIQNDQQLDHGVTKNIKQPIFLNRSQFEHQHLQKRSKSSIQIKSLTSRTHHNDSLLSNHNTIRSTTSVLKNKFNLTQRQRQTCLNKYKQHNSSKYQKLLYGHKNTQIQTKLLNKQISKICSQKIIMKKWKSPFQFNNSMQKQFQGKNIVSKNTLENKYVNNNPTQLKVLNIDRLFRKKEGKLTNVVPLPAPKFQAVTARKNVNLLSKNKDKIHNIIQEFNNLLHVTKLLKAKGKSKMIGVKGKNFTKNPTFQQLMGLKLKPKLNLYIQQSQYIEDEVFLQYCQGYKQNIYEKTQISQNIIRGIKQNQKNFNVQTLTRFYKLFVNRIATSQQKSQFFQFFFVKSGQQYTTKDDIVQILQTLCKGRDITSISSKLNIKTQTLTPQQKQLIFLQALVRVLFNQISQQTIHRDLLRQIFLQNQQAVELLMKLILKDQ